MQGVKLGGRYRIESEISRGGMAVVWLAVDEVLERQVAAKILHEHLAADDVFRERFRVEALAAAKLTHPNVVAVYDTGDHGPTPYIVMEYLPGGTLAELSTRRKTFEPGFVARLGTEVCAALSHAHEHQIIHRDVKPGNILFSEAGHTKVTDFGIAKAAFAGTDLTDSGAILGTVRYLSPEQVRGESHDERSDIYSLGVVLYECATGRPPFRGENDLAIATARLGDMPLSPRDIRPDVPRELDAAIMRSLAIDPAARFQHARDMQQALGAIADEDDPTTITTRREIEVDSFVKSEGRWLVPAIIVLLLAAGLVGLFTMAGPREALKRLLPGTETEPTQALIDIVAAGTYDPEGNDKSENDEDASLVTDDDPGTFWRTDKYKRRDLGGLKSGVGIYVDLGEPSDVSSIRIVSTKAGWRGSIRTSDDGIGWSAPVQDITFSEDETVRVEGNHRYWMLWITQLAEMGTDDSRWWVEVKQIQVR